MIMKLRNIVSLCAVLMRALLGAVRRVNYIFEDTGETREGEQEVKATATP